jgi:hypothetical protein
VREKYINGTKERQENITTLKQEIQKSNRIEKEQYDKQYLQEMRIIAENEEELSDMVYKKTQYQKEKVEREVEESR